MDQLKKTIIDNLYKSNFYEALINIEKLEKVLGQSEEICYFYYFLYDLMEWVDKHKNNKNSDAIKNKKILYFNKINEQNKFDKSTSYLKMYKFLDKNFRTFDRYTWFGKKDKSIKLLKKSLKENPNNFEAQFYTLLCEEKTKECFEFLYINTFSTKIVQEFLSKLYYQDEFLDDSKSLRIKYKLDSSQNNFIYNVQKKNYEWLYNYFNDNKSEIYKTKYISFGKVCFELKKYDEAIEFYISKENKKSNDYYVLGECYEGQNEKQKAIECYQNYYIDFQSGYWKDGIEKLLKLKAYDVIKDILKDEKSDLNKVYKIFYEAKLLNIAKKYSDSINKLNSFPDILNNQDLKKDIFLLYISNYYKKTFQYLESEYKRILETKDFELNNTYGLGYQHYDVYRELEKYIKKLNIEFENKYLKKTDQYKNRIHKKYIALHQSLYNEAKKINFKLTEDKELYFLSAFDDYDSINKRIEIYEKRVQEHPENPQNYLNLGRLNYTKANRSDKDFTDAAKNLNKSIELAQKYFINLNGESELLLLKINEYTKEENKQLFDESMKNFIFHNSYQKDIQTVFFDRILYKYQSFSMNSLSSLANDYLYFASPDKLNDPFDVASKSLEKQFENLELDKQDFKLCSLSKINNNKLMWSHYTNEHTGICVGYKFLYLPNYVGKEEVIYKNTNLDEKDIFQNIIDYWTVKSEDWEYEQEIRLLHYGKEEKIPYTFDVEQAFKNKIIALQIDSIILGLKFREDKIIKQIIKDIEKKQKLKIATFKTKIIDQTLVVEKINI